MDLFDALVLSLLVIIAVLLWTISAALQNIYSLLAGSTTQLAEPPRDYTLETERPEA